VRGATRARLRELLRTLADPMAIMLAMVGAVYLAMGETRNGVLLLAALGPMLGVDVLLEARSRTAIASLRGPTLSRWRRP